MYNHETYLDGKVVRQMEGDRTHSYSHGEGLMSAGFRPLFLGNTACCTPSALTCARLSRDA